VKKGGLVFRKKMGKKKIKENERHSLTLKGASRSFVRAGPFPKKKSQGRSRREISRKTPPLHDFFQISPVNQFLGFICRPPSEKGSVRSCQRTSDWGGRTVPTSPKIGTGHGVSLFLLREKDGREHHQIQYSERGSCSASKKKPKGRVHRGNQGNL